MVTCSIETNENSISAKYKLRFSNILIPDPIFIIEYSTDNMRLEDQRIKITDNIITADDVYFGKPHAQGIRKILKSLSLKPKDALYIGDSIYDYEAGRSAKVKYRHASWGYDKKINKIEYIKKIYNLGQIKNIF